MGTSTNFLILYENQYFRSTCIPYTRSLLLDFDRSPRNNHVYPCPVCESSLFKKALESCQLHWVSRFQAIKQSLLALRLETFGPYFSCKKAIGYNFPIRLDWVNSFTLRKRGARTALKLRKCSKLVLLLLQRWRKTKKLDRHIFVA